MTIRLFFATRLWLVFFSLFVAFMGGNCPALAKVTLSKLFHDGGVIQKDKPVNVFGTGRPGEIVTCEIGGNKAVCIIKNSGNFLVSLPPPAGPGPLTLRVAGDNLLEVKNLQLGQVWLVAGDDDIDQDSRSTRPLIDPQTLPANLQLFKVGMCLSAKPVRAVEGHWIKATEPGAMTFSALGLRFGCDLAKQVGGPIAIIQVSCPESPIRAWISEGGLLGNKDTSGVATKSNIEQLDFNKQTAEYKENLKKWQSTLVAGQEPSAAPLPGKKMRNYSSALFNGMLAPLTPLSLCGAVWHHGKSDLVEVLDYKPFLSVFMKDLRQIFRQEGLPIILVQTGALAAPQVNDDSPVSVLRQVQFHARLGPRTYMAVSLDLDQRDARTGGIKTDFDSLAQRITNIALSTQYHTPAAIASPVIDTLEKVADGEALKLQLRYADKGLSYTGKGEIKGFTISSWNHQYFDAQVVLEGDSIVVQSKFVKDPKFVRYCWGNLPTITLFNKDGLPLVPYTSDR